MKIGLFIPCYVDQFYPKVGIATYELLQKLGCDVRFPMNQTCCGQPMANSGYEHLTKGCDSNFIANFTEFDYIVCPSGSCVLHVKEHLQDENNEVLDKIINAFDINEDSILLGLKPKNEFLGYYARGDFNFQNGKLNKPEIYDSLSHVFVGIQIIHPKILQNCPKPPFSMNYFYNNLKNVKGVELSGKFFHVGDIPSIALTEQYF